MARRSKSQRGRGTRSTSNFTLPLSTFSRLPGQFEFDLRDIEDRRLWHPDPFRPAATFTAALPRLDVPKSSKKKGVVVPRSVGFVEPHRVLVCVRRTVRKQVMHAMGKAGKRGQKKPRRNAYSEISCKE